MLRRASTRWVRIEPQNPTVTFSARDIHRIAKACEDALASGELAS